MQLTGQIPLQIDSPALAKRDNAAMALDRPRPKSPKLVRGSLVNSSLDCIAS